MWEGIGSRPGSNSGQSRSEREWHRLRIEVVIAAEDTWHRVDAGKIHGFVDLPFLCPAVSVSDKGHAILALKLCATGDTNTMRDMIRLGSLQGEDMQAMRAPMGIRLATVRTGVSGTCEEIGEHIARSETDSEHRRQVAIVWSDIVITPADRQCVASTCSLMPPAGYGEVSLVLANELPHTLIQVAGQPHPPVGGSLLLSSSISYLRM